MHNTDTSRQCAICGHPLPEDHFYIEERWSKSEVESSHILPLRLSRSQIDDQGRYVFYFCRWRHLGDFLSECGLTSTQRRERDEHADSTYQKA